VYLHGGVWTTGDLDTHDEPCRLLCRHAGAEPLYDDVADGQPGQRRERLLELAGDTHAVARPVADP
jgi:hypothetical protein